MYEPLWVGILLPFSIHRPWCFKRAPLLAEMGRDLHKVLAEGEIDGEDILQKLLKLLVLMASMSEHMACGVLHVSELPTFPTIAIEDEQGNPWHKEEERHRRLSQGVNGSHMCIPVQCKVCWMRNLEGRDPVVGKDDVYKACISSAQILMPC